MEILPGLDAKALGECNLHICSPHDKELIPAGCPSATAKVAGLAFDMGPGVKAEEEGSQGVRTTEKEGPEIKGNGISLELERKLQGDLFGSVLFTAVSLTPRTMSGI